jgi:hypothetical protein
MSEITQKTDMPVEAFSAPQIAATIHDVFKWSRGELNADILIMQYFVLNFRDQIKLELLPEAQTLAITAVTNTISKYHYDTPINLDPLTKAESEVADFFEYLEDILQQDMPALTPPELGLVLITADYAWLPATRRAVNDTLQGEGKPPRPPLGKPFESNLINFGFLGKSPGRNEVYKRMFLDAARQVVEDCTETAATHNFARDQMRAVAEGHQVDNPEDGPKIKDKLEFLF